MGRARPHHLRFWEKVNKDGSLIIETQCWEWTGGLNDWGYGLLWVNRRNLRAHRISYELANGPTPEKALVLHRCDNAKCVRPDHLFLGTNLENMRDMIEKGRAHWQRNAKD